MPRRPVGAEAAAAWQTIRYGIIRLVEIVRIEVFAEVEESFCVIEAVPRLKRLRFFCFLRATWSGLICHRTRSWDGGSSFTSMLTKSFAFLLRSARHDSIAGCGASTRTISVSVA